MFLREWDIKKGGGHLLQERQVKFKFSVEKMCKTLGVSKSSYYNWVNLGVLKK